eukprot:4923873-Pyramimonas_sp.AAC.1
MALTSSTLWARIAKSHRVQVRPVNSAGALAALRNYTVRGPTHVTLRELEMGAAVPPQRNFTSHSKRGGPCVEVPL